MVAAAAANKVGWDSGDDYRWAWWAPDSSGECRAVVASVDWRSCLSFRSPSPSLWQSFRRPPDKQSSIRTPKQMTMRGRQREEGNGTEEQRWKGRNRSEEKRIERAI